MVIFINKKRTINMSTVTKVWKEDQMFRNLFEGLFGAQIPCTFID